MRRSIKFKCNESKEYLKTHKGVYKLINTKNNHFYIGSTDRNFYERFLEHCGTYQKYLKYGGKIVHPPLWNAYDKYGIECFKVEIIDIMDNSTEEEIHAKEGQYIRSLKPEYNVCLEPELSGSPNKGRKLSKEWKQNIAIKAALYTHSLKTLAIVTANNKANACKIIFTKDKEQMYFNSWVEVANYFNITSTCSQIRKCLKNNIPYKGWIISQKTTQKKKILVHFENEDKIFNSFNECDRALNMWRGYTSTMYTRKNDKLLDKYKYELI